MPVVKLYHSQIIKKATKYKSYPPKLPWNIKDGVYSEHFICQLLAGPRIFDQNFNLIIIFHVGFVRKFMKMKSKFWVENSN